jgi:hypothetical protein
MITSACSRHACNQRQPEAIRGNQRQAEATRGDQRRSEASRGDQRQAEARRSEAINETYLHVRHRQSATDGVREPSHASRIEASQRKGIPQPLDLGEYEDAHLMREAISMQSRME